MNNFAVAGIALLVLLAGAYFFLAGQQKPSTLIAVGDIASCESHGDEMTYALVGALNGPVLLLGDAAYPDGSKSDFEYCFEPSWGEHRERIRPAPGNHEYHTPDAKAYFDYFGKAAGIPGRGYYSFDYAGWHIVSLNSNCSEIGGCGADSPQGRWLAEDLAGSRAKCTLAFMHHPLFSSGSPSDHNSVYPLWKILYENNADLVLAGHMHSYERFAPMAPDGKVDYSRGMRLIVVGTGGVNNQAFREPAANSEVRSDEVYGALKLTLFPDSYQWEFVPVEGQLFTDAGAGACR